MPRWTIACAALLTLVPGALQGQINSMAPGGIMSVLIGFNPKVEPWAVAPEIARTTGMKLVGVSPSTHSALFILTDETNVATGRLAATYQEWIQSSFPGTVSAYNYGPNLGAPRDLERTRPATLPSTTGPATSGRKSGPAPRFSSSDRLGAMAWRDQNRLLAARLRVGMPLEPALQLRIESVPSELLRRLGPVLPGSRYVMIAGTLVLLDSQDVVQDVIRFEGATP